MPGDDESKARVRRLLSAAAAAQRHIRGQAAQTRYLVWTDHMEDQMEERSLAVEDILIILRNGYVDEDPKPGEGSDLKATISLKLKVGRSAAVAVAINENTPYLILLTTFWVDENERHSG